VTAVEVNQRMFDQVFRDPVRADLDPPEMAVVERFRDCWHEWDVLELGAGDGRVAYTLGAIAKSYLGIDYAPQVVDIARRRFGAGDRREFQLGDARDLPRELDGSFDAVWFPFNGLDNVNLQDRSAILTAIHRVLRPDGYFYMSCHSLNAMPFRWQWPRMCRFDLHNLADAVQVLTEDVMMTRRSRSADISAGRARGWLILRGPRDFRTFYTTPRFQVQQLESHGFEVLSVMGADGTDTPPDDAGPDESLHYLCRRSQASGNPQDLSADGR
jgi:SAM-dependent methyltransferase